MLIFFLSVGLGSAVVCNFVFSHCRSVPRTTLQYPLYYGLMQGLALSPRLGVHLGPPLATGQAPEGPGTWLLWDLR